MATKPKDKQAILSKTTVALLTRTVVFLAIFTIFSGILGPHIISNGLVGKDGFQIYGGAGKAVLFGALCLLLLVQRKGLNITLKRWHWTSLVWLVLAVLSIVGAWHGVNELIAGVSGAGWPIFVHACLWASIIFAAGASFGPANLRLIIKTYKREILVSLGLAAAFFGFLYIVYGLWEFLAAIVLHSVHWLLDIFGLHSTVLAPRTLLFDRFGINIAQYCSGIESIALFAGLYALVGVLDWPRLNHRRFLFVFLPALLVLFGLNILRVATLIAAGYYIDPQIAFSLFHTYAGMIFFIVYSLIFWKVSYAWMLRNEK